jgi:hypothetical protein
MVEMATTMERGMRLSLSICSSGLVAVEQYFYWTRALTVAAHISIWREKYYWTSGGPGNFLPWPHEPGYLTVMTEVTSQIDQLIFELIKSNTYILVALSLVAVSWLLSWLILMKLGRKRALGCCNNGFV